MKIEYTKTFQRGLKRCRKRGWTVSELEPILEVLISRGFSHDEVIKYHDHMLTNNLSGHRAFHPRGRSHNWVVIYHYSDGKLVLDDVRKSDNPDDLALVIDDTGTHDEVYGENYIIFL